MFKLFKQRSHVSFQKKIFRHVQYKKTTERFKKHQSILETVRESANYQLRCSSNCSFSLSPLWLLPALTHCQNQEPSATALAVLAILLVLATVVLDTVPAPSVMADWDSVVDSTVKLAMRL